MKTANRTENRAYGASGSQKNVLRENREFLIMRRRHHYILVHFALPCVLVLWLASTAYAQWAPMNPVTAFQKQPDGVLFTMKAGTLKLQVCADSIIHVRYS